MAGDRLRFYTDENVSWAVINGLRQRGVDVMTTPDADMLGRLDEEQLALATEHGRVLFTHDDDFLRLHSQEFPHTGIVYTHQTSSISRMIRGLMLVYEVLDSEYMAGHLECI